MAQFFNKFAFGIGIPEADANARAFVDGIAAMARLDQIRAIMRQQNVRMSVMWKQIADELDDD